ncbi:MAG TPA: SIMPL domain-containing protein [Fulvivirga sp.]|nr:SIMPL domain-containing protein [Fulvivirga sp.]
MNKIISIGILLLVWTTSVGQPNTTESKKRIEVKGTAEMEVVPDEIYLKIALKEYKNGSKIVNLNTLEAGLVKAVSQIGLPKENLTVDNIYGYNWDWRKKKSDDFLATKSFKLKLTNVKMMNDLIEKLDAEGVNSMNIGEVSHSKIEEYKMELKIKALQNAKDKANALLTSIGEQMGGAIEIQEIDYGNNNYQYARNTMSLKAESDGYQSDLEYKTITLNAEVRAVFEIK